MIRAPGCNDHSPAPGHPTADATLDARTSRMREIRLGFAIGLAAVALAAAGCGDGTDQTSPTGPRKLIGTVGSADDPNAYEIELTTEDGTEVTTVLPPGRYRLEIDDRSPIHNFHLDARRTGADVATDVAGTGEKTAVVALREDESYIYLCDAHPARMQVTFSIHGRIRTQN